MIHSQLRFAVFEQLLEKALVFNLEEREGGQSHWFAACSLGICARNVPVALRLQQQLWLSDDGSSRAARAPSARQRGPPFQINPAQKFSTTPSALHPLLLCPATLPIGSACGPLLTVLARTVEAYPAQFALAGAGGLRAAGGVPSEAGPPRAVSSLGPPLLSVTVTTTQSGIILVAIKQPVLGSKKRQSSNKGCTSHLN